MIRHINLQIQEHKSKEIDTKPLKAKIRIVSGGNRKMAYATEKLGCHWASLSVVKRIVSLDGV